MKYAILNYCNPSSRLECKILISYNALIDESMNTFLIRGGRVEKIKNKQNKDVILVEHLKNEDVYCYIIPNRERNWKCFRMSKNAVNEGRVFECDDKESALLVFEVYDI